MIQLAGCRSISRVNLRNRRVELDNGVAFDVFRSPREIYGEPRYRFHY